MQTPNANKLREIFSRKGYAWMNFHIVGIRSTANEKNKFDDFIGIVDGENTYWFNCTTNAGRHWLLNLMNPKGCAVLKPNQYLNAYKIGLHKGEYKALVQYAPVEVYRDNNKNEIAEEIGVVDKGLFGINIHRANPNATSSLIEKWSAGCQVINNPVQFENFMNRIQSSGMNYFTYTLLKESDL
jgi:hypothetical protein